MKFRQYILLLFLLAVGSISGKNLHEKSTDCDRRQCRGPILYYDELSCRPIYEKAGDCCPVEYDCSNLVNQSASKCYATGKEYGIGERLNTTRFCKNCVCKQGSDSKAGFLCEYMFCDYQFTNEVFTECYVRQSYENPCCGEKICVESLSDKTTCKVDGRIYEEGESFVPQNDRDVICYCLKGYKGENIEPFCKRRKCRFNLEHNPIRDRVVPVYVQESYRAIYCPPEFLHADREYVIHRLNSKDDKFELINHSTDKFCQFGNRTIPVGDEFYAKAKDPPITYSTCYKCLCEVPPLLSCSKVWFDCDLLIGVWHDFN